MEPNDPILNLREAAKFLGVHFQTLKNWVKAGKITHLNYPNDLVRFRLSELVIWQESKTVVAPGVEHPTARRGRKQAETAYEKALREADRMLAAHSKPKSRKRNAK